MPAVQHTMSAELLPHDSLNEGIGDTILFIHGAFTDRNEWDMVTPHLHGYHLLVPDLPGHGKASYLAPFSLDRAAQLLAQLIKAKAKDGVAHIVGLSLGASVAVYLASKYPEVVKSMVVTGKTQLPKSWFTPYLPYAVWLDNRFESAIPSSVTRWLMDGTDLRYSKPQLPLIRQIFVDALSDQTPDSPWPARTLVIAATKKGIVPSNDNVDVAKKLAETGRQLNASTYAVEHKQMRHPWNRQNPQLFAATVRAWIEGEALPVGFERL